MAQQNTRRVMIGTPAHDWRADVRYVDSLIRTIELCSENSIKIIPVYSPGDALIQRARNHLVQMAVDGDVDDLFFIDSDQYWEPEWVLKLLEFHVDVVGAPIRKKTDEELYNVKAAGPFIPVDPDTGLWLPVAIGTGFMCLSRTALRIAWDASDEYRGSDGSVSRMVFDVNVIDGELYGEDTLFCAKMTAAGIPIHLDWTINVPHVGQKVYVGDFAAYVEGLQKATKPMTIVERHKNLPTMDEEVEVPPNPGDALPVGPVNISDSAVAEVTAAMESVGEANKNLARGDLAVEDVTTSPQNITIADPLPPIFIGGAGRSGTTLLRVMLDSHPNIACGPEIKTFPGVALQIAAMVQSDPSNKQDVAQRFKAVLDEMMAPYWKQSGKPRTAVKVPHNVLVFAAFHLLYPESPLIHVIRDARDVVASLLSREGWGNMMTGEPMECTSSAAAAAKYWVECVTAGLEAAELLPDGIVIAVFYEHLVQQQKDALSDLMARIGEPWDAAVMTYYETERDFGDEEAEQVAKPVYTHAIGRYRQDLSGPDLETVMEIAGPLMQQLGYVTEDVLDFSAAKERAQPAAI